MASQVQCSTCTTAAALLPPNTSHYVLVGSKASSIKRNTECPVSTASVAASPRVCTLSLAPPGYTTYSSLWHRGTREQSHGYRGGYRALSLGCFEFATRRSGALAKGCGYNTLHHRSSSIIITETGGARRRNRPLRKPTVLYMLV